MFKKITAIVIAVMLGVSLLALNVLAGAMNPADGCQTSFTVKKASVPVSHDGVISQGEYEEIEINRDPDTTDMLLTWDGSAQMVEFASDFLGNVHYYVSWDDGAVNFAAQATLLEDPYCAGTNPETFDDHPGDEFFMFQFGFLVKIENLDDKDNEYLYYAIGKNTETGELLEGYYRYLGHVPCKPAAGQDYNVSISGRTVTYEISFPLNAVLAPDQLSGGAPIDGAKFSVSMTLSGGSLGDGHHSNATYAVSLGDGGYMTSTRLIGNYSGASATLSNDTVAGSTPVTPPDDDQGGDTGENPGGGSGNTPAGPSNDQGQTVVVDPDQYEVRTDDEGNEVIIDRETGEEVDVNTLPTTPAKTGDPMVIIAAVAAVSAAGAFIVKKRKF